jgi:hypothetical protein
MMPSKRLRRALNSFYISYWLSILVTHDLGDECLCRCPRETYFTIKEIQNMHVDLICVCMCVDGLI